MSQVAANQVSLSAIATVAEVYTLGLVLVQFMGESRAAVLREVKKCVGSCQQSGVVHDFEEPCVFRARCCDLVNYVHVLGQTKVWASREIAEKQTIKAVMLLLQRAHYEFHDENNWVFERIYALLSHAEELVPPTPGALTTKESIDAISYAAAATGNPAPRSRTLMPAPRPITVMLEQCVNKGAAAGAVLEDDDLDQPKPGIDEHELTIPQ
jgi:hypothetical protein